MSQHVGVDKKSCSVRNQYQNFKKKPKTHCSFFSAGYYSIGNSRVKFPWRKVSEGQDRFAQIVDAHRKVSTKDHLKEELFQMMADKTR